MIGFKFTKLKVGDEFFIIKYNDDDFIEVIRSTREKEKKIAPCTIE